MAWREELYVGDLYVQGSLNMIASDGESAVTGAIQLSQAGTGYSFNLIAVESNEASGNTRALRVNATTSASIAHGDLQCVHGYLTLGSGASLAANAAVYPLSAWLNIPDTTTVGSGAVLAGVRAIFDPNNNDLTGGGVESAIFYGQTWASTGQIDSGVFISAGAGSTIDCLFEFGSAGTTVGESVIGLTSWGEDTLLPLVLGGPSDNAGAHWGFWVGDASDDAGIKAEVPAASNGSLYASTSGELFVKVGGTWTATV